MVAFLLTLLLVSIAGLVALIGVKQYEMSSGRVLMGRVRPKVGGWLSEALHVVERGMPGLLRGFARRAYVRAHTALHRFVAWTVIHTERGLEQVLHVLRHTTSAPRQGGEASAFLREVAEHKKSLQEEGKQGAIYEE